MSAPRLFDIGTNGNKKLQEQQRQEKGEPRLSDNGTNQQEQRSCWKDTVGSLPTKPDQFTTIWCEKGLDMDEQNKNRRVVTNAATTNANSIVQRNPKSNPGGEQ